MEINGLPLHPLVVHAAVVFGPLAVLSALAYVGLPQHRDKLRWVTLVVVLIAFAAIWAAYLTGENFFESDRFDNFSGEALEKIEHHEELAGILRWVTTGFALVTVVAVWQHERPEDLIEAFPDLEEMTEDCPRGCTHGTDEPECGLDEAVAAGRADPDRVSSFRRLLTARSEPAY